MLIKPLDEARVNVRHEEENEQHSSVRSESLSEYNYSAKSVKGFHFHSFSRCLWFLPEQGTVNLPGLPVSLPYCAVHTAL